MYVASYLQAELGSLLLKSKLLQLVVTFQNVTSTILLVTFYH